MGTTLDKNYNDGENTNYTLLYIYTVDSNLNHEISIVQKAMHVI